MAGPRRRFVLEVLRRVWKFVALFASVYLVAVVGFYVLQGDQSPLNAFYWAIVTISTAGYGDVVPTTSTAKLFAMAVLFTQVFLIGYLFSVIGGVVTEESQRRALGTLGTDMRGHIVVLGYTAVGRAAVRELLAQEQRVAVVAEAPEDVANLRVLADEKRLFATYGPPAEPDILTRVNVGAAHAVVVCTADDATNMIAALNLRRIAPAARIVVAVARPELRDTLRAAGVTYVASPSDMGGRLCASAAFEPDVANAIEELTAATVGSDLQEYVLGAATPVTRESVEEAERLVRTHTGCLLVGYARRDASGEYRTLVNPPPTDRLAPGDALVILGTIENARRFRRWFGVEQGR